MRTRGVASLLALLFPGVAFAAGLFWASGTDRYEWLRSEWDAFPWQLWVLAGSGIVATLGGIADWAYHRWGMRCGIGRAERRCELIALTFGGVPLFFVMVAASISASPLYWLVPSIVLVIFIVTLICFNEFVFHRKRCGKLETFFHRLLVFGNGLAWLAWVHWCFVSPFIHA